MRDGRPPLVAPVGGFAGFVLAPLINDGLPSRIAKLQRLVNAGRLHPDLLAEVVDTWAGIRAVAQMWDAADGIAADPPAAMPEPSQEIDTDRAAGLLGVTPNRVRQLARSGDLPGRKAGGVWLVDRAAVDIRRSVNSGSFR